MWKWIATLLLSLIESFDRRSVHAAVLSTENDRLWTFVLCAVFVGTDETFGIQWFFYVGFLSLIVLLQGRCPLCREPLAAKAPSVNITLRGVIEKAFPSEYQERVEEGKLEEEVGWRG